MGVPILGTIGKLVLPAVGKFLKGKLTNTGIATTAIGLAAAGATGQDPFESAKVLIDLARQAWPHVLVVAGALMAVAGWFRKAGWAAARDGS